MPLTSVNSTKTCGSWARGVNPPRSVETVYAACPSRGTGPGSRSDVGAGTGQTRHPTPALARQSRSRRQQSRRPRADQTLSPDVEFAHHFFNHSNPFRRRPLTGAGCGRCLWTDLQAQAPRLMCSGTVGRPTGRTRTPATRRKRFRQSPGRGPGPGVPRVAPAGPHHCNDHACRDRTGSRPARDRVPALRRHHRHPGRAAGDAGGRRGTLLYTTGAGSIDPVPQVGNVNAAAAALRNWVLNLHKELDGTGIQAAHVGINVSIGTPAVPRFPDGPARGDLPCLLGVAHHQARPGRTRLPQLSPRRLRRGGSVRPVSR